LWKIFCRNIFCKKTKRLCRKGFVENVDGNKKVLKTKSVENWKRENKRRPLLRWEISAVAGELAQQVLRVPPSRPCSTAPHTDLPEALFGWEG
jgi:hypothetical protein